MKIDVEKQQYWEGKIMAWQSSGLTQGVFCEREQLKHSTFDYWRRRIKPEAAPVRGQLQPAARPMTLVPVQVERSGKHAVPLELHGATWRLTVPATVDTGWLAALLRSLA